MSILHVHVVHEAVLHTAVLVVLAVVPQIEIESKIQYNSSYNKVRRTT
jgi:hypothetical protein